MTSRTMTAAIIGSVAVLAAASLLTIAAIGGSFDHGRGSFARRTCAVPALAGTVIDATLTNMGGPMMRRPGNGVMGGMMRLSLDRSNVSNGQVTFLAINGGNVNHELIILPLPTDQIVGTRRIGADAKVDEAGSLGEASSTCAQGSGQGIAPGAQSWVTVTLPAGRYEVICNLPGHYAAGMYAQLTVT